ncbi:hypothetical protein NPIL_383191 [Nephila pilipes]|uniref:Endonuclease/exonuclease/phosphatase domain-containing protein n=1 Tax=Nephila pilipes TaxID=299642 RepID=A0A8X6NWC5_NEPPI|nr:hypothetical protein NPIL_383191 [Nephila pilipes]
MYQNIDIDSAVADNTDLEIQGIKINWREKMLNIYNVYLPPNQKKLAFSLHYLLVENTIIIGDLNAKHLNWGCSGKDQRGLDLIDIINDCGFIFLNDGTSNNSSYGYSTSSCRKFSYIVDINAEHLNWGCSGTDQEWMSLLSIPTSSQVVIRSYWRILKVIIYLF